MYRFFCLSVVLVLFASCESVLIDDEQTTDPYQNFDYLWNYIDTHYPYLDYKQVNWEEERIKYRSKLSDNTTERELFNVMRDLLNTLKDGHIVLRSPFENYYYPIPEHENFDFSIVEEYYLDQTVDVDWQKEVFVYGILDDDIGYVYYRSFNRSASPIDDILKAFDHRGVKGLILDIRDNNGGKSANVIQLAGRFTATEKEVGYVRFKTDKDNFSEPLRIYVHPTGYRWNKPVMLLTNRGIYSAGSYFSEVMRQLDGVTLVGTVTGGGGGMPNENELPNGWFFRVPVNAFYGKEGFNIENGVPPDIYQEMNMENNAEGQDGIIERAKKELEELVD
ncbi:S41 family peptidase [Sinomicrobium weinanense]|uniref:Peptidase S41 n=1 Tax=Sinomicrobium weinanense TaxID=2842200 RepID=A0A926Q0U7_9FLAO|nr:S41 family peptidase [Sinomicrobium weinanense]MBC9795247.1 peptidase S41 [Sinomicrobium weinanense]MBU3125719.1 hypothetical protein [Sinomicrobium weinanense]